MKKCVIIWGVFLLLLLSSIVPFVTGSNISSNDFIYVDDDNIDGPWDGSIEHPYQTINDGVIASIDGDTVYVNSGIYGEGYTDEYACIKIDRRIHLLGEDKYTTIIDANQSPIPAKMGVVISVDEVRISGFTIQNAVWEGGGIGRGISIDYKRPPINDILISDNIIINNDYGIIDFDGNNCKIYNNIISNNVDVGILAGDNSNVYENLVLNNTIGIFVSSPSVIEYNQIMENEIGVYASHTPSTIRFNNFINNDVQASFIKGNMLIFLIIEPLSFFSKQRWNNNYWDDWRVRTPRPIKGELSIVICPLLIFYHEFKFPSFQFDWNPAKEPYDIGGNNI